jgi:Tol biopolymer transport system component
MSQLLKIVLLVASQFFAVQAEEGPLGPWRSGVRVKAVTSTPDRHTIHAYFNVCPESPDGRKVLYYTSTARDGQTGDLRVLDRATGEERTLVRDLHTEDAHRAACQQWVSKGRRVVFHDERDGEWQVAVVDVESGAERVLAKNRLSSWGRPDADLVPLYGLHWKPGEHRDLELLNVDSGEIRTVLTNEAVRAQYAGWIRKSFGERPTSIFFPVLSPDLRSVFFKMAAAGNGDPRSKGASERLGKIGYSLEEKRFLFLSEQWGHPAWHPDSKTIVETKNQLIRAETGVVEQLPGLPDCGAGHPSASPDGKLLVSDTTLERFGGSRNDWGIVVMDIRGNAHVVIHKFDNSHGASSWRVSHPHPVFSADGRRIYFNVSSGPWTQLHVAERGDP